MNGYNNNDYNGYNGAGADKRTFNGAALPAIAVGRCRRHSRLFNYINSGVAEHDGRNPRIVFNNSGKNVVCLVWVGASYRKSKKI